MTYNEETMRRMDAVLRGDSRADMATDGGWPDPNWAYNTCCGKCGQGLCAVDQMTGA